MSAKRNTTDHGANTPMGRMLAAKAAARTLAAKVASPPEPSAGAAPAATALGLARHLLALAAASRLLPHATATDAERRAEAALAAELGRALGAVPGLAAAGADPADPGLADADAVERCRLEDGGAALFGLLAASLRALQARGHAAPEPEGGAGAAALRCELCRMPGWAPFGVAREPPFPLVRPFH